MSRITFCVAELIGHTPLIHVNSLITTDTYVIVKLEAFSPASSVRDRTTVLIIDAAEASGELNPGDTTIEAASGSTGIVSVMVGTARGYRVVIVMPESMSIERRVIVRAFGAEFVLTDPKGGITATIAEAEHVHDERPGSIIASQLDNPISPAARVATTDEETRADTEGQIDVLVVGINARGTISGIAKFLKAKNPDITIITVQPAESPFLADGNAGLCSIQGLMPNLLPGNYDASLVNEVIFVKTVGALGYVRRVAAEEGLLVGISSGAALVGTALAATHGEFTGKTIVTPLPDAGRRYLSTVLFNDLRG